MKTLQLSNPDGTVVYRESGTGEPLILIHGVGMQADSWEAQIACLEQSHRVIALNMPGHGGSTPLAKTAMLEDFVAWLHRFVTVLDCGAFNLAGHSMGALIAGGYSASYPDNVRRVALLNGVYRRSPEARNAVIARVQAIMQGTIDIETPLDRWFDDRHSAARAQAAQWLSEMDMENYAIAYNAFANGDETYADCWGNVICPALFLTGDGDPNSTPAMAQAMADATNNGSVYIIKGHRHMVNMTAPNGVNQALQKWLAEPEKTIVHRGESHGN